MNKTHNTEARHPVHNIQVMLWMTVVYASCLFAAERTSLAQQPDLNLHDLKRVKQIYVPIEQLGDVIGNGDFSAVLSKEQFEKLLAEEIGDQTLRDAKPRQALVHSADYTMGIEDDRLFGELVLSLSTFDQRWNEVEFNIAGWNIESASLDGQPVAMTREGKLQNLLRVFVDQPGQHQLLLQVSAPLMSQGGDKAISVSLPQVGAGEFQLILPAGKYLESTQFKIDRPRPAAEPATYRIPIGGTESLSLRITDRSQSNRGEFLTFASTAIGLHVLPSESTWIARTELQVFGQEMNQLRCLVPSSLEITDVQSTGLESWELADAEGGQTAINLQYRQGFEGRRTITFKGILADAADDAWSVPTLVLPNVTSHTGAILIQHPTNLRLQAVESNGVRPVSNIDLPELQKSGEYSALQYQIWDENFDLRFASNLKQQEVHAAMTNILDLTGTDVFLYSTISVEARLVPLFEFRIEIPDNWQVSYLTVNDMTVDWRENKLDEGGLLLRIPLTPPLSPGNVMNISLTCRQENKDWPPADGALQVAIPEVSLPQVEMLEALYGIAADHDLKVTPQEVSGLDPGGRQEIELLNQKLNPLGKSTRLAYSYQDIQFSGIVEVSRKPTTLYAETLTFFRIDEETLFSRLEAKLDITGGGIRELEIRTSASAGTNLRFQIASEHGQVQATQQTVSHARLVEQIPGEVVDEMQLWTLRFDRYLTGPIRLYTDVRRPRDSAGPFSPARIEIPSSKVASGYLAVESSLEQHVTIQAMDVAENPLSVVDPVEFPSALYQPQERVVAGYRYTHPDWTVNVSTKKFERGAIPTVIGHQANLTSVLSQAGQFQHQAMIEFTAVGAQALIVNLPEGASLWATLLDGQPVEVRRSPAGIQIPIVGLDESQHQLQLTYSTVSPPLDRLGVVTALPPSLSVVDGGGSQQAVEILTHQWDVHFPEETLLISSNGLFEPSGQLFQATFFDNLRHQIQFPSESNLFRKSVVIVLTSVVLALIWFILKVFRSQRSGRKWRRFAFLGCGTVVLLAVVAFLMIPLGLSARHGGALPTSYYGYSDLTVESASEPIRSFATTDMDASGVEFDDMDLAEANQSGGMGGGGFGEGEPLSRRYRNEVDHYQEGVASESRSRNSLRRRSGASDTPPMDAPMKGSFESETVNNLTDLSSQFSAPVPARAEPQSAPQSEAAPAMPEEESEEVSDEALFDQDSDFLVNGGQANRFGRMRQRRSRLSTGGLLSMTFDLEIPDGTQMQQFHYQGNGIDTGQIDLRIRYANQTTGQILVWSIALGIALMGWWLRHAKLGSKSLWAMVTVLMPVAFAWSVPELWQLLLQGILFGGLISLGLWAIHACWSCCRCCCGWLMRKTNCSTAAVLIALFGLINFSSSLQAESKPVPPTADAVIIPYQSLDEIDSAERVWVPQRLYRQLWKKAHPQNFPSAASPIQASIAEANYQATLQQADKDFQISIKARWVVTSLADETVKVTLPVQRAAISSVTVNGEVATLDVQLNGTFHLLLRGKGVHVVDGELRVPADVNGRLGQFQLNFLPVNTGQFLFDLPEEDGKFNVRVDGLTRVYRRIENDGQSQIQFPIDRGGRKVISWFPEAQRGLHDQLVQVETAIAANIEDAGAEINHAFQTRVRQGAINDLTFKVPAGLSVREISGEDIGGWELNEAGESKELKVFFRRKINDQTSFFINMFYPLNIDLSTTEFDVPTIVPQGVTRETVQLAVFGAEHLKLRAASTSGVNQIAISRYLPVVAPATTGKTPVLAYRTSSQPYSVKLHVERRRADAQVQVEHGVHIGPRKRLVATRIVWQLSEAPRRRVDVIIPEGYLPMSVVCAESSDWYVHEKDGNRILSIEFPTPRIGRIEAGLEGHFVKEPDVAELEITLPRPLAATRQSATLGIWVDSIYQATLASIGGWDSLRPNQLSSNYKKLDRKPVQFALQSRDTQTENVTLNIQEATPRLNSDLVSVIAVSDVTVDYGITIRWNISQAAAETFTFNAPTWMGELDIQGAAIREIQSEQLDDERTRWTVSLIDPVREQYLITIAATVPLPQDQLVKTPILFTEIQNENGEHNRIQVQQHYALLVNLSQDQLAATDPEAMNAVALEEVPLVVHEELAQQAMEVIRIHDETAPTWRIEKMEQLAVAKAIILAAHLETVLELDGSWRTKATYGIRNRGRQFLALRIPEGSRVLSVFVRDKPARTVINKIENELVHLVALPQTSITDLSFDVEILMAGRFDRSLKREFALRGQQFAIPAPEVLSQQESVEFGLPVTQTLWTVHLPEEIDASVIDGVKDTNLTPHESDAWLAAEEQALERMKSDIAEMARLAKDKSLSKSRRSYAKDNLKRLNISLSEFGDRYFDNEVRSDKASELREELLGENRFLQEQAEKALEEVEVELQADDTIRFDVGRDYIINNNSIISSNNGEGLGITLNDESKQLPAFNFLDVSDFEQAKSKAQAASAGKKTSRSKLKSQIAEQKLNLIDRSAWPQGTIAGLSRQFEREVGQQVTGGRGINLTQNGVANGNMFIQSFDADGIVISGVAPNQSFSTVDEFALGLTLQNDLAATDFGGEVIANDWADSEPSATQPWTSRGGLSIEMILPKHRQTLSFSKVGGGPALTLNVQPSENRQKLWGITWAVALIILGFWVLRRVAKTTSKREALSFLSGLCLCLAIVGFYALPNPESWPLFWLFFAAGVVRIFTSRVQSQPPIETSTA